MFNSIILPGMVALLVTLLTNYLKDKHNERNEEFKEYEKLGSYLRRSVIKSNPSIHEADFIWHVRDMQFMLDNSKYIDNGKKKLINEMINTLECQFAYITKLDLDKETLEDNKKTAITSINNISIEFKNIQDKEITFKKILSKFRWDF